VGHPVVGVRIRFWASAPFGGGWLRAKFSEVERNGFAFNDHSPRVGEPEMEARCADLGSCLRRSDQAGPRIMRRFVDVVLQIIEHLPADPDDVIFNGVTMEREILSDGRAGEANAIAVVLARKAAFLGRVPQHAVSGVDMKARRNDLLEPVSELSSKIVRIHCRIL
jgi:hypothetical protein